jgi:photosystem II stability/assembly factor-like uncharacterized protein
MFSHLDDPAPPEPDARALGAVLERSAHRRWRRAVVVSSLGAALIMAAGVFLGLALAPGATPSTAAFYTRTPPIATAVPPSALADVVFVDRADGFALAAHGTNTFLAASHDGGVTWSVVSESLPVVLPAQLEFTDLRHGYLWGGEPDTAGSLPLWVTSDGGTHWRRAGIGPVVQDVSAVGPDVWALVGDRCAVGRLAPPPCAVSVEISDDAGLSWTPTATEPPVADPQLQLARITRQGAYVLSYGGGGAPSGAPSTGALAYTPDGGATWGRRPDPCAGALTFTQELAASGTDDLWMVCASEPGAGNQAKALYRSSDGGRTWVRTAGASGAEPALGRAGAGGLPQSGYVLSHENLAVLSPTTAWLFPDRGAVSATTDGGATWAPVMGLTSVAGGGNITFIDPTHGWVAAFGVGLWRTEDGTQWERLGSTP